MSILSIGLPRFPLVRPTDTAAPLLQPTGDDRASQVPSTLLYIHAVFYRPRQALQELACIAPFVLASAALKTSPPASSTLTGLNVLRGVRAPLRPICFPVYASSVLFDVTRSPDWRIRLPVSSSLPLSFTHPGWMPKRRSG